MYFEERVDDKRVVHVTAPTDQDREGIIVGEARTVRTIRSECIKAIDHRENPGANRNVSPSDARRIPGSIPVLMMVSDDGYYRIRKIDRGQHVGAETRVKFHFLEFGGRKL